MAKARADATGSVPAAIQVAKEIERRKAVGDIDGANLLHQTAKTYAIDRGMNAYGLADALNQPAIQPAVNAPSSLPPVFTGLDPAEESRQAILRQQQTTGVSPAQRRDLTPQAIPGYAEQSGGIKATQKRMETQAQKDVELKMNPLIAAQTAEKTETGKGLGETKNTYEDFMSAAPGIADAGNQLYMLADTSTYTLAGRGRDMFLRQFNFDPTDSAKAKAKAETIIATMVLPLLRPTFGAQFTAAEGKWMRDTLGDPNLSGPERQAQIKARMDGWQRQAEQLSRRTGADAPASDMFAVNETAAPTAVNKPRGGSGEIRFNLKKKGYSDAQIQEYIKARGL